MDMGKIKYKIIVVIITLLSVTIGFSMYMKNTGESSLEVKDKEKGFERWQENVMADSSEEGRLLREALSPDNPVYVLNGLQFQLKNYSTKIFKDTKAAIKFSPRIPQMYKFPLYEIDKTIKEAKDIYSIKFIDENGKTLKDKNGKEMIYHDGDKIILNKLKGKYRYVLMRKNQEVPFVYGSQEGSTESKVLDITTVPITYMENEEIASILYSNINANGIGKTYLNIIYGAPLETINLWNYHLKFKVEVKA